MSDRADLLLQGSWNGVAFQYLDAGSAFGQRGQVHEYTDRDDGDWEGLGQRKPQYILDVFVLGDDWIQQRQALVAAFLQNGGKGTLIHPLDGRLAAICIDIRHQERVTELGRADFTVTIIPDSQAQATPSTDSGSAIDSAKTAAAGASQTQFADAFQYVGQPQGVLTAAQSSIGAALNAIANAAGFALNVVGGALSWYNYGVSVAGAIERIVLNDSDALTGVNPTVEQRRVAWQADLGSTYAALPIVGGYAQLGVQLHSLVSGLSAIHATGSGAPFVSWAQQRRVGVSRAVLRPASPTDASAGYAYVNTGGYSETVVRAIYSQQLNLAAALPRPVPPRGQPAQATVNANAIADVVRQAALIEAAGAFGCIPFDSRDDAFEARDRLAGALDAEAQIAESGDVRKALRAVRLAVVADATRRSAGLPDQRTMVLPRSRPAVVLAASLYDDPGMAQDLVRRNRVDNPLFMPAGRRIRVLSDG